MWHPAGCLAGLRCAITSIFRSNNNNNNRNDNTPSTAQEQEQQMLRTVTERQSSRSFFRKEFLQTLLQFLSSALDSSVGFGMVFFVFSTVAQLITFKNRFAWTARLFDDDRAINEK